MINVGRWTIVALGLLATVSVRAQSLKDAREIKDARQIVETMLAHEGDPAEHRKKYIYVSEERSDRTGGHLWREHVAETAVGKVRLLLAEDGQPLSAERLAAEKARLAEIVARPDAFQKKEQSMKNDEQHAEQMLALLHQAFLFNEPHAEGRDVRIEFRPDPAYQPKTLEEKVLHAMSGTVLVDERTTRLHRIEGKMLTDVSLGYGILGTIYAGSSFSTTHEMAPGDEWKSSLVTTAIEGKALFFKNIGKTVHTAHSEFKELPGGISIAQAVEMLMR